MPGSFMHRIKPPEAETDADAPNKRIWDTSRRIAPATRQVTLFRKLASERTLIFAHAH